MADFTYEKLDKRAYSEAEVNINILVYKNIILYNNQKNGSNIS